MSDGQSKSRLAQLMLVGALMSGAFLLGRATAQQQGIGSADAGAPPTTKAGGAEAASHTSAPTSSTEAPTALPTTSPPSIRAPTTPMTSAPGGFVFGETIAQTKARCIAGPWAETSRANGARSIAEARESFARELGQQSPPSYGEKWEAIKDYRCLASLNPTLSKFETTLTFCEGKLMVVEMRSSGDELDLVAQGLVGKYGPRRMGSTYDQNYYIWDWPDGGRIQVSSVESDGRRKTYLVFRSGMLAECRSREADAAAVVRRTGL